MYFHILTQVKIPDMVMRIISSIFHANDCIISVCIKHFDIYFERESIYERLFFLKLKCLSLIKDILTLNECTTLFEYIYYEDLKIYIQKKRQYLVKITSVLSKEILSCPKSFFYDLNFCEICQIFAN